MRLLRPTLSALVIVTALACAQVVSASELVVIAADNAGAQLVPGKTLKAGSSITLAAGGRVTVLAQSGEVIKLKGPFSGPIKGSKGTKGGSQLAAVSKLLGTSRRSATLGATRAVTPGSGQRATPGNIWIVEAHRAGKACVRGNEMMLWRPTAGQPAIVALWPLTGAPKKIDWPAGKSTHRVSDQPLADGVQLSVLAGGRNTAIVLSVLPDDIDAAPGGQLLQWMAARGCRAQANKLIRQLHGDG
ncbi:MAG: hypothetical protein AAGD43_24885 [Pseudomonadota bacterium]